VRPVTTLLAAAGAARNDGPPGPSPPGPADLPGPPLPARQTCRALPRRPGRG